MNGNPVPYTARGQLPPGLELSARIPRRLLSTPVDDIEISSKGVPPAPRSPERLGLAIDVLLVTPRDSTGG